MCEVNPRNVRAPITGIILLSIASASVNAELTDVTQAPNNLNFGIQKSFEDQVGLGRGDVNTPNSSMYIIKRDPFRSIRRGRQLFQRKFTHAQGLGPRTNDGIGNIGENIAIGAGLTDSCAACHGRPRGAAGFGGDVATRPDSRDAPHLFGLGLVEMLGDEITTDLREIRDKAITAAQAQNQTIQRRLVSKGIRYGYITAHPDGSVDTSGVRGVNPDLRVRPFFHQGGTISIREFVVGAFKDEMGLQSPDPDLHAASQGADITTPAGMVLSGSVDTIETPPAHAVTEDSDGDGVFNEIPTSAVDHMEFYLLNYFKPATYRQTHATKNGRSLFMQAGCGRCHIPNLTIARDRRVADVDTVYDPQRGIFNRLFATAIPRFQEIADGSGNPTQKLPLGESFVVEGIYADFRRHDLGPAFWERNYDGTIQKEFMTEPLWGVGSTAPYGHDGRSINLHEVIIRHGGEARKSRNRYAGMSSLEQQYIIAFLQSLVLFPPDDTASNLSPGDPNADNFPQEGHGSINLGTLFNDPSDPE